MARVPASDQPTAEGVEERARTLLLACLQASPGQHEMAMAAQNLDEAGWHRFGVLAAEQRVRPSVRAALMKQGGLYVPAAISSALDEQCRQIAMNMLARHGELIHIVRALAAADIPVIVLKGACLGPLVYRDIAAREMNDLDLLVPGERLQSAADVLLDRGYKPRKPFSVEADVTFRQHLSTFMKGRIAVEIHWNVTQPGRAHTIDPGELWRRAVPMPIGSVPTLRLSLEDLLLHLCVHSSYQHHFECGLRPSCDIAAMIREYRDRIDWDAVCRRSEQWRWSKGVYVALALSHRLVGADVPPEVLSRLQGGNSADVVGSADRLLWTAPGERAAFFPGVSVFGAHAGWAHRIRRGLARLILSPSELAWMYSIQRNTPWLLLYYVRRAGHVLWTHGPSAIRLLVGRNPEQHALAERRDRMQRWLLDS
jgi:hypothetical protein